MIKSDVRDHLSIGRKAYRPLKIDPNFSMTDTEIRFPRKKPGVGIDQYESFTIPLDEISAYYITEKSLSAVGVLGILAGAITVIFGTVLAIQFANLNIGKVW